MVLFTEKAKVLDKKRMDRVLTRMAHQILENSSYEAELVLVGVATRGIWLAKRLASKLQDIESDNPDVPCGALDITSYRDDRADETGQEVVAKTEIPFDVTGKRVILVDDVLYTGRTVRAALDALNDLGRPESVKLAVLVDRGLRELPIQADVVGKYVPTSRKEYVKVKLREVDGVDMVVIGERQ